MNNVYLLDTNIITGVLKKDANIVRRLNEALKANALVVLSCVAFYEIKRGLLKKDVKKQLVFFEQLAQSLEWADLLRSDWDLAAQLWAVEANQGRPLQDTDLLMATQARRLKAVVVTNNEKHFANLGATIENWLL